MPNVKCTTCGKSIDRWASRVARAKHCFCDRQCKGKWQSTQRKPARQYASKYRVIKIDGKSIKEHRHVVECAIGRQLSPREDVHHIDGNTLNNAIENLAVVQKSQHMSLYHRKQVPVAEMLHLRRTGMSLHDLANRYGVAKNVIRKMLNGTELAGMRLARLTFDVDLAIRLVNDGVSREQVGRQLGIHPSALTEQLQKRGISCKDTRFKHDFDIGEIRDVYQKTASVRGTAKHFSVPYGTMRKYLIRTGLQHP